MSRVLLLAATAALAVGMVVLSFAMAGCESTPPPVEYHGRTDEHGGIPAVYDLGTLTADLPRDLPTQSVIAAAEASLRRRGYTITASESTTDAGRVVARPPGSKLHHKVTVRARVLHGVTRTTVEAVPQDEAFSRAVLESMLTRLGL